MYGSSAVDQALWCSTPCPDATLCGNEDGAGGEDEGTEAASDAADEEDEAAEAAESDAADEGDEGTEAAESDAADEGDEATEAESDADEEDEEGTEAESDAAAPASLKTACARASACKLRATAMPMQNTRQALGKPYLRHASKRLLVLTQLTTHTTADSHDSAIDSPRRAYECPSSWLVKRWR